MEGWSIHQMYYCLSRYRIFAFRSLEYYWNGDITIQCMWIFNQ